MPPFLFGLASTLIDIFAPLAKEKITKEIARHGVDSAAAGQITQGLLDAAQKATGKDDPLEAVVAAKADPAIVQTVQAATLAKIDDLAPLLDKLAAADAQEWTAEETSRDAATARAKGDPNDQDPFLTHSIVGMLCALLLVIGGLIGLFAYLKVDTGTLVGLFATIAGGVAAKFSTRYDHRYGSSRSSGEKDALISQLSQRQ
jgi:hypothetical protein